MQISQNSFPKCSEDPGAILPTFYRNLSEPQQTTGTWLCKPRCFLGFVNCFLFSRLILNTQILHLIFCLRSRQ